MIKNILNRWTGAVQFAAEIDAKYEGAPHEVQLGAAVKAAFAVGARLDGARLDGARLDGARLDGARLDGGAKIRSIIARVVRSDGYEFFAFDTGRGVIIRAGCRQMTREEYRAHVPEEYPNTDKAIETLDIIDFIDLRVWRTSRKTEAA